MKSYQRAPFAWVFYPFVLLVLFAGIAQIYKKNPALMDHLSLLEKKQKESAQVALAIPIRKNLISAELILPFAGELIDNQRSNSMPGSLRTSVRFSRDGESWGKPHIGLRNGAWNLSQNSILIVDQNTLLSINLFDELNWKFEIGESESFCTGRPVVTESAIFACTQDGKTFALDPANGSIIWYREGVEKLIFQPTLNKDELLYVVPAKDNFDLEKVSAVTGKTTGRFSLAKSELAGLFAVNKTSTILVSQTNSGSLVALNFETGKALWNHENPTGLRGSPVIVGNRLFTVSEDGSVVARDLKTGKEIWQYSVEQKVSLGMTVIPDISMGFVIDDESYLHAVDLDEGKRKWRLALKAPAGTRFILGARANAEQIKKLVIPDGSKDWVIWSACGDDKICGYDPRHGIPLARFTLGGPLTGSPLWHPEAHTFWIPYRTGKSGQIKIYGELPKPPEPTPEPTPEPKSEVSTDSTPAAVAAPPAAIEANPEPTKK